MDTESCLPRAARHLPHLPQAAERRSQRGGPRVGGGLPPVPAEAPVSGGPLGPQHRRPPGRLSAHAGRRHGGLARPAWGRPDVQPPAAPAAAPAAAPTAAPAAATAATVAAAAGPLKPRRGQAAVSSGRLVVDVDVAAREPPGQPVLGVRLQRRVRLTDLAPPLHKLVPLSPGPCTGLRAREREWPRAPRGPRAPRKKRRRRPPRR